MAISTSEIQALYIAYFNRPADFQGLQFWTDAANNAGSVAVVANEFSKSKEYTDLFAGKSTVEIIDTIYMNLFGRHAEPDGLAFWGKALNANEINIGNAAYSIFKGAQNLDKAAIESKVSAATAFYAAIDTADEIIGYSGEAANNVVKSWLAGISDAASLASATSPEALAAVLSEAIAAHDNEANPGQKLALTVGVDTVVGTAGNDIITGGYNAASAAHTLSGLDTIDGGAGVDTLILTDTKGGKLDFTVGSVKNVEKLVVSTANDFKSNTFDLSKFATGLSSATITAKTGTDLNITAATDTALTINNDSTNQLTINGAGGILNIATKGLVDIGSASLAANKLTSVSVTGAAFTAIKDNSGTSAAIGSTLTTVILNGQTARTVIEGDGVTNLTVANTNARQGGVDIGNRKAHVLSLTVDAVNYGSFISDIVDSTATSLALQAKSNSAFGLSVRKATTITVSGAGDVTLLTGSSDSAIATAMTSYASLSSVTHTGSGVFTADLSNARELLTVNAANSAGSLNITIAGTNSAAAGAAAQSVTGGAGNDKVTITGTLGKGSVLSLGGGSDVVTVAGGTILGTAVVDAGDGIDTLSLSVVNASNVGAFKNFELFDVAGASGTFDQSKLDTMNKVTGFVGSATLADATTLNNLGAGVNFTQLGHMGTKILSLIQATPGTLTITTDVDAKAADATTVSESAFATNATAVNIVFDNNNVDKDNRAIVSVTTTAATTATIVSGGTNVANTVNLTDEGTAKLESVVITGSANLTLNVVSASDKLSSVDASGLTGALGLYMADLTTAANVKLGAGDDVVRAAKVADSTAGLTTSTVQSLTNFKKATGLDLTVQNGFDVISFGGAVQAADKSAASATAYSIKNGLYTLGSGVTNFDAALEQIGSHLAANETVVFNYLGTFYVFGQGQTTGHADDMVIKLDNTSGITGLDTTTTGNIYVLG